MEFWLEVNGVQMAAMDVYDYLPRAVLISLFSWRRANADDSLPSVNRFGWWGDTFPDVVNDQIGSRLWLLSRSILTSNTAALAQEYAAEALQWLIDDGAASAVDVLTEIDGNARLSMAVTIKRGNADTLNIRFADIWNYLNV